MHQTDGAFARTIGGHGFELVGRGLDCGYDVFATLATDALGESFLTLHGDLASADQIVDFGLGLHELGQAGHAHGPPLFVLHTREPLFQIGLDLGPRRFVRKRPVQTPEPLQPGFEGGFGLARLCVPALQVVEHEGYLRKRMHLRIGQLGARFGPVAQQCGQVELVDLVGVLRPPAGRIGQQLYPQVAHRIAQARADAFRKTVGLQVLGQHLDRMIA